jgi:hypothetical protein
MYETAGELREAERVAKKIGDNSEVIRLQAKQGGVGGGAEGGSIGWRAEVSKHRGAGEWEQAIEAAKKGGAGGDEVAARLLDEWLSVERRPDVAVKACEKHRGPEAAVELALSLKAWAQVRLTSDQMHKSLDVII